MKSLLAMGAGLLVITASNGAWAAGDGPEDIEAGIGGNSDGFDVSLEQRRDGTPAQPASSGNRPASTQVTETRLVPTCLGNRSSSDDALCAMAATACPEPGDIRMWVYRRTFEAGTPESARPGFALVTDPPFRCVGPDEEQVDPLVVIAASIEREFQRAVVLRAVAETNPAPRTLVNVPTRLETPTVERYDIPLTLLGQSVVITAQAERWTWHTGEGIASTQQPGTRGRVEWTYRTPGVQAPYVVITWSGTYSVNGRPMGAIPGTVTTQGLPGEVDVREARTELVDG